MTFFTAAFIAKIDIETLTDFICIFHRSNVLNSEFVHFIRTVLNLKKNAILLLIS